MMSYHTFYAEYRGATPEEVIQSVYADAKAGTDMSFEEWWQYQKDLWKYKYGKEAPDAGAADASHKLLKLLVDVGALEPGEK